MVVIPEVSAKRGCYQCAYEKGIGFVCPSCGEFRQCPDCLNMFCKDHIDPVVHVRHNAVNTLDTCAKRTACLNRVADGIERRKASGAREPARQPSLRMLSPGRKPYKFLRCTD